LSLVSWHLDRGQDLFDVLGQSSLEVRQQVRSLGQGVGDDCESNEASLSDDDWVGSLEERVLIHVPQALRSNELGGLASVESDVKCVDGEGGDDTGGTVDVITHSFEHLATLGLHGQRLLLIGAVEGQIDKLAGVRDDTLSFFVHRLHQIHAQRNYDFDLFGGESIIVDHFSAEDDEHLNELDNEVRVVLVSDKARQVGVSREQDRRLDQNWSQTLSLGHERAQFGLGGFLVLEDESGKSSHALKHLRFGLVQDLVKLLQARETDDRLGVRASLVRCQSKESSKDAHDGFGAGEVVEAHVVLGFVLVEYFLEHVGVVVKHFERVGHSDSKGVARRQDLVEGHLALHLEHVSLEVGDIEFSHSAEGLRQALESLLKSRRREHGEEVLAKGDRADLGLKVVHLLETSQDEAQEVAEDDLEVGLLIGRIEHLASVQQSVDDDVEVVLELLAQRRRQAGLDEQAQNVGDQGHLLLLLEDVFRGGRLGLDSFHGVLGHSVAKVLQVYGEGHLAVSYLLTFFRVIAFRQQCEYVSDVVLRGTFKDSELIHEILSFVVISRLVKLVDREGELSPGDLLRSGGSVLFHNG